MNYFEIVGGPAIQIAPPLNKPEISIEFPTNGLRARKVISRSNAKGTGKYPGWKMSRLMHHESPHECSTFKLLDVCPEVSYFQEQPCRIRYVMNGGQRTHYPDILVKASAVKELLEVKTPEDAETDEVRERTAFMQCALPLLGYGYRLLTSDRLSQNPRLKNAEKLLRFGRPPVSPVMREHIRQIFKANGNAMMYLGNFRANDELKYRSALFRLILEGVLKIDFNQPLGDASPINWAEPSAGGASWE